MIPDSEDSASFDLLPIWRKLAEERGWALAQYWLGGHYFMGDGVEQDYEEAVRWWTLSAEQGDEFSARELGDCYLYGTGVNRDLPQAYAWLWLSVAVRDMHGGRDAFKECEKLMSAEEISEAKVKIQRLKPKFSI